MKFRIFLLLIFIFYLAGMPLFAWSQEIEVSSSKPDFNYSSTHLHKIIGHDSDHYYVIKFHSGQYYFEKLDNNLNLLLSQRIKLFEGLRTYELESVFHFYNELYIFVSRRRFNDIELYYQRINKSNLLPATELIQLTSIRFIKGNWPDFHFALSRHEKKLLVACQTKPLWSKIQFNEYYVFGENMELIWKRKDNFEFTGQGPRENKYVVDEEGNVSMLSLQKRQSILSLFSETKNIYTIYRYTSLGRSFYSYPVTFQNRYIRGIKIMAGENGELFCAGLYSEIFRAGVRGSFFFKIFPEDGNLSNINLNEFDEALLNRFSQIKEPIIAKDELINYIMTDLVLRQNGKIVFIAEQFFRQTYDTYNNLLVICYDDSGNIYWTQVIEKNQDFNINTIRNLEIEPADYRDFIMETGVLDPYTDNYCSYALMAPLDGNSIIVFYNDDIKNLVQPDNKKNFNRPRKSFIMAVTLDEFGNISEQPVLKWKRKALFPEPMRFYDTLYDTIVIPAFKGNKYNYFKITASNIK